VKTECTALALYDGPGGRRWRLGERKRRQLAEAGDIGSPWIGISTRSFLGCFLSPIEMLLLEMEFAAWMVRLGEALARHRAGGTAP
jgi:hypothetical protein